MPDKKTAALDAALQLLAEQGFQGAPMSEIAARAGIGVGTIYRYFASKDELINALYLEIKSRFARSLSRSGGEELPVRESYGRLMRDIVRYCRAHPAELSFVEQYENSPMLTAATREEASRLGEPINSLFQRALEQKLLKDMPREALGALITGALFALIKLSLAHPAGLEESAFDAGIDAIWEMVRR